MVQPIYPSDLTDHEWALLSPLIPVAKPRGRPRVKEWRLIVNGLFYVLRTGCPWRYLPREYGPWQTVYYYFRQWRLDGTWQHIHTPLRELERLHAGRDPTPSAAIIARPIGQDPGRWGARLRWGQEAGRAQAPHSGGYTRVVTSSRGPRG